MTASYGTPFDLLRVLGIFIHYLRQFMSAVLYHHQTFTDCVSNQYSHFDMLTYQMKLQGSLV